MIRVLLDVNVLIALLDEQHQHYERANAWFTSEPDRWWLTCPITENGAVRIIASPSYTAPVPMREVHGYFRVLADFGNHAFVPDDISLMDETVFRLDQIRSPKQITDTYLLA